MISSEQFSLIFKQIHNFQYDDLNFLSNKYQKILFTDIPEAWVGPIDDFLYKVKDLSKIQAIYQLFGFIIIKHNITNPKDKKLLVKLEQNIVEIDTDLYKELSECSVLN